MQTLFQADVLGKPADSPALETTGRRSVYDIITDRILCALDSGTIPWRMPWNLQVGAARSLVSGRPYRGVNVFLLGSARFASPYWVSFKQAKDRGGSVRKGERGYPCIFWKRLDGASAGTDETAGGDDAKTETGKRSGRAPFVLRYYTVFNVLQTEGVEYPKPEPNPALEPIASCESIVAGYRNPPTIRPDHSRASYCAPIDTVEMPPRGTFETAEHYYATLFHELGHSTGHASRLNRPLASKGDFQWGGADYSREELVAEMTAAYLCGSAGIENTILPNAASYIAHWRDRIKTDARCIVIAAAQAQKAADHILGTWAGSDGSGEPATGGEVST